jgi:DNA-binding NtrC family response regulator
MQERKPRVRIVADESAGTRAIVAYLSAHGIEASAGRPPAGAEPEEAAADGLVVALDAPGFDGLELLARAMERDPGLCAVAIAADGRGPLAAEAARRGASDVQALPVDCVRLLAILRGGFARRSLASRVAELERRLDERYGFEALVGRSRAIVRVVEQLRAIAPTRAPVLIEGEEGTGRGLAARLIHQNGPRRGGPWVHLILDSIPESLAEGELFGVGGHDAADAPEPRRGPFERADGGTLFVSGIDAASASVQVRLLRAIQERTFERVGSGETLRADVRLIADTRLDLAERVRAGRFRGDLHRRLSAVKVGLPPLRERPEDIPLLVEAFVRRSNHEHGRRVTGVTRGVLDLFTRHRWPGNVRQLRETIDYMVIAAKGRRRLELSDVPARLREPLTAAARLDLAVGMTVEEAERKLIAATLRQTGHDKPRAAAMLGIGLRTLYRKLKRYAIR